MAVTQTAGFDDVVLAELRQRRSEKWTTFPADVLPAAVAELDFGLAPVVRARLHAAVELGDLGYASPNQGRLADAFATYARDRHDWVVDRAGVVPVPDLMSGVAEALRLVTRPGAGVVINPPVYQPFRSVLAEIGRTPVDVPLLRGSAGYELDLAGLDRAFAAGAAAYLMSSPHNPVGRVWTTDELRAVVELADRHDVVVVSDEIHAPLTLPGARHRPYLSLGRRAARHGISIMSASKAWNLPALKCAVLVTEPGPLREIGERLPVDLRDRVGHLGVLASETAWREGGAWLDALVAVLDRNSRALTDLLARSLPAVRYPRPQAGYLAWLDVGALGLGDDPAGAFLERGRVGLVGGRDFGPGGEGFVRLNFGTSAELLVDAVRRMAAAVGPTSR